MLQRWLKLTFLHWPYEPEIIRPLIPKQLTLDTFDGAAWVGLVPFLISGLRPPWMPVLPWISTFPETNVRTYVRAPNGDRGVWFFTLEADRLLGVMGARVVYHLPYRWAAMTVEETAGQCRYRSKRSKLFGSGSTNIAIEPGPGLPVDELANFLTARFWLYALKAKQILTAPIHHQPWLLQSGRVRHLEEDLICNSGVPSPSGNPLVHYSADLTVKIGRIQMLS